MTRKVKIFTSIDEAIKDPEVYNRAQKLRRESVFRGTHEGPHNKISSTEIYFVVKELGYKFTNDQRE